jgi:hypothetical protein
MNWSEEFIIAVGFGIGACLFLYNLLYCIYYMYSFYVDERKYYNKPKTFGLKRLEWDIYSDRSDYIFHGVGCIAVGLLISAVTMGCSMLVMIVINEAPTLVLIISSSLLLLAATGKIHRTVNNVRYKLSDHISDKNAHESKTEEG